LLRLCINRNGGGAVTASLCLKNPAYSPKKATSRPELRSEHPDSSSVSQLVALIKNIGDVEPELEQTVILRKVKYVGESQIQRIIPR
jgi:hypothetical protein